MSSVHDIQQRLDFIGCDEAMCQTLRDAAPLVE